MIDIPTAKSMAKILRKELDSHSLSITHSACLEMVAHQFQVKDWNTFVGLFAKGENDTAATRQRSDELFKNALINFKRLLTALYNNDYDAFMENGSPGFKARITRQNFEGVHEQIRSQNHETTFLEELKQGDQHVFLWKIHRAINSHYDSLARLHMLDGRVEHFWIF